MAADRTRHPRRRFLRGSLALAGLGLVAGCGMLQPPPRAPKIARIGVLTYQGIGSLPEGEAFRQGLRELGWVPGERPRIDSRFASSPEAVAEAVTELVGLELDAIVAEGNSPVRALKSATASAPIVMANSRDPVAAGLVASLSRPGGNVTGLANFGAQLSAKQTQLIKEILPGATRIAVAWNPDYEGTIDQAELQAAVATLGVHLRFAAYRNRSELGAAFETAVSARADALLLLTDQVSPTFPRIFRDLSSEARLPTVVGSGGLVRDGGALLSYGPSVAEQFRRAATYVDKILRGANPADLPIEQPTTFELVVNLKTAQALGLTMPRSVLAQTTEVIQ